MKILTIKTFKQRNTNTNTNNNTNRFGDYKKWIDFDKTFDNFFQKN